MLGYVDYRSNGVPAAPTRVIEGLRFRAVYVRRGDTLAARLSAHVAARALHEAGVRCAVFPPDYPHRAIFALRGILPPPLTPLCHALAAEIVRRYAAQCALELHRAAVAFVASRVTPELRRAVWELSAETRYIVLRIPGSGELARALRRERGVAARVVGPEEALSADLTVCFEPCKAPREGMVLPLYAPESSDAYAPSVELELYAALFLAGALDVRPPDGLVERLTLWTAPEQSNRRPAQLAPACITGYTFA